MTRRENLAILAALTAAGVVGKDNEKVFQQILEASLNEKKGVNVYLQGQAVPGIVTKIAADHVEMRSREFSRIVVKLDAIQAVAMS